jgi:hypothetical protein
MPTTRLPGFPALPGSVLVARAAERRRRRAATSELARVLATTDAKHRLELETLRDELAA